MKRICMFILLCIVLSSCENKKELDNSNFKSVHSEGKPFIDVDIALLSSKKATKESETKYKVEAKKFYSALKRCYNTTTEVKGLFYPTLESSKEANVSESVYTIYIEIIKEHNDYILKMREKDSTFCMNNNRKRPVQITSYNDSIYSVSNLRLLIDKYLQ